MTAWPAPGGHTVRRTGRHRPVVATLVAVAAAGVLTGHPAAVLAGAFAVGVGAYASAATPPAAELAVSRSLSASAPAPGDELTVALRVHNRGERPLPELRVRDAVPDGLAVVDGPPRLATTLRPGETATVEYRVRATVGGHAFDPPLVVVRDVAGAVERATRPAGATTAVECDPADVAAPPTVRPVESGQPGAVPVATGGEGVAFHAVREYRRGDPPARVDWARLARTGELATVDYRETHAARVVLVVDDRPAAAVAPAPDAPPAAARCREAAAALAASLLDAGHQVGVAALDGDAWVPPAGGGAHRTRIRAALSGRVDAGDAGPAAVAADDPADDTGGNATATDGDATAADGGPAAGDATAADEDDAPADPAAALRARLSPGTQVLVCSPLVDDVPADLARRLDAGGHPAGVVAPDPTVADSPGRRLATVERRGRLRDLRAAGLPVVDWRRGERLATALDRGWDA